VDQAAGQNTAFENAIEAPREAGRLLITAQLAMLDAAAKNYVVC